MGASAESSLQQRGLDLDCVRWHSAVAQDMVLQDDDGQLVLYTLGDAAQACMVLTIHTVPGESRVLSLGRRKRSSHVVLLLTPFA